ncbi:alpha/beta hydrolase [Kutzneria sp. CA-103260]|uniref:alpha/beta hydrolase n=1 Tax=Kutzneria sp. CA-103260 TaxID=2802641 RepID=UPI001BA7A3B4|nr:alpha/beta hydrolase [Kutzneria sp. CA-103260]QUQ63735.1 lipase/esterase [Kutzneria sp. CA-103260]
MTTSAALARCEPAVLDWIGAIGEVAAGLPDLQSTDWTRGRKAARELADVLARRFTLPGPAECQVEEYRAGAVTVRRYRAPGDGVRAAHLSIHGGGFVHGSIYEEINERLLRRRAVDSGVDIFAVAYRLAPEHPFPAGLEDCIATLVWLIDSAPELRIDPERIGVGGSSAGGNLAALVAAHARDLVHHQVLEVPAASLDISQDRSFHEFGELEPFGDLTELRAVYLGTSGPVDEWTAPNEVSLLDGLPPAFVLTAECDPLRDCGQAYAARMARAGVDVQTWCGPGQTHGSPSITRTSAIAREWHDRVSDYLRTITAA